MTWITINLMNFVVIENIYEIRFPTKTQKSQSEYIKGICRF